MGLVLGMVACGAGGPGADATDVGVDTSDSGSGSDSVVDTPTDTPADTPTDTPVDTPSDPCLSAPFELEGGLGERDFVAFPAEGTVVESTHGPQGGWHYWGAIRVRNSPQLLRIGMRLDDETAGVVLHDSTTNGLLVPIGGGTAWSCQGTFTAILGVMSPDPLLPAGCTDDCPSLPEVLCGHSLRLTYTARSAANEDLGSWTRSFRFQTDPNYPDAPCP
jgi:hypothetical protein